jgi:hypothetical protein
VNEGMVQEKRKKRSVLPAIGRTKHGEDYAYPTFHG